MTRIEMFARRATRLVMILAAMQLAPAAAQQPSDLRDYDVGVDGSCPTSDELRRIGGRFPIPEDGFGWTFVMAEEPEALQIGSAASFPVDVAPPQFSRVAILGTSPEGDPALVRWRTPDGARCGWLRLSELLAFQGAARGTWLAPPPVEVRDIDPADPQNSLSVKAVLSNLNLEGDQGVPVYAGPTAAEPMPDRLRLFEFYSVFDVAQGQVRGENRQATHFLIGQASDLGDQRLMGWVHAEDVYLWNSRMAVFFNDVETAFGWPRPDLEGEPILEAGDIAEQPDANRERMPVVSMTPTSREVQTAANSLRADERTALNFSRLVDGYFVVTRAQACRPGQTDCVTGAEFARERAAYQAQVDALRRIDLLFLVDATESMERYFPAVAEAVEIFARERLRRGAASDIDLRVAVAVYGDYVGSRAGIDDVAFEVVTRFHDPSVGGGELQRLRDFATAYARRAPRDTHGDFREASLAALVRAARDADWRPDAGLRTIVHLADHGSRDAGATSGEGRSTLVETLSTRDAVDALTLGELVYIPISVLGRGPSEGQAGARARAAFVDQARDILRKTGLDDTVLQTYGPGRDEAAGAARDQVLAALEEASRANAMAREAIERRELCARAPSNPLCRLQERQTGGGIAARIRDRILESDAFSTRQIENIYSREESVIYAWVPPVAETAAGPRETLSYWVAVSRDRLPLLTDTFGRLCESVRPSAGDTSARIVDALTRIARESGGEYEPATLSQSLATALSLPFWERTELLSLPLGVIERTVLSGDEETLLEWRRGFCRTHFLMRAIESELWNGVE